ncbi:MAG TPA: GNAT family N-acetyltransferase [Planctomycetaceae bacterium]|nr:GNAT family N-acetyltransferase [Planctomycetaceae bacterium]
MNDAPLIRAATVADVPAILGLIRELAEYERLLDMVVATEASLQRSLFGPRPFAEALIAEVAGEAVGFAVFFHNFSTFLGKPGVYLEDLFVRPAFRGRGLGKALLTRVARIAVERDCGRMEWSVLHWNEPAIRFYESLGARPLSDWTMYRLTGDTLRRLGGTL